MAHRGVSRRGAMRLAGLGTTAALAAALMPGQVAAAQPAACDNRSNNTYAKLLECVTVDGVREHQAALQKIADNSTDPVYPGTRAAGTVGYTQSVEYVKNVLEAAGYQVTLDPVELPFSYPSLLQQLTPDEVEHDSTTVGASEPGDVTGDVVPVDINLVGDRASTSG